jgi:hypothetical protein
MHRPGIAEVSGDRIILDGTTIDEAKHYHRNTLVLCVEETNRKEAEYRARLGGIPLAQHPYGFFLVVGNLLVLAAFLAFWALGGRRY